MECTHPHHKDGVALAAIMAAGIGAAVLGLATILATASPFVKDLLNWWAPAGPLTGKTGAAVLAWLISWGALHLYWRARELPFGQIYAWAMLLIALGWLGTFPPIFERF